MFTSKLYKLSPVFIQNILLSSRAFIRKKIRENTDCKKLTKKLQAHEFNFELLNKYIDKSLSSVLTNANEAIDYYKGTGPDINKYSYIDKPTVNSHKDKFLSPQKKGAVINGATSGTTGAPLVIPQGIQSVITEQAFVNRGLAWAGFKEGDKRAWIRGDMIVPMEQKQAPFWRYSYLENMILLSSFHMATSNLQSYINAMVDFDVQVIQAYPSSIVMLAKYLEVNNEYYPGEIKSVVTSSESLTKEDKHLIETRFKCTVFDWYGLFERVAAIASCEHGRYHILTDYAHVELLPAGKTEDGRDRAEIVGTNFNNSLYPLIRYKTGDHVVLSDEPNCPCGRVFPIVDSIEGRTGDYLIADNGQKVHILNHIPKGVSGLLGVQFLQKEHMKIEVLVTCNNGFTTEQKLRLIDNTKERLGNKMDVTITIVDDLKRTKNGKMKQAICDL